MFRNLTKLLLVSALVGAALAVPGAAEAKDASRTQTTKIDIKQLCEREKIQVCHWEGKQHICVWVDGPNCAIY